MMIFFNNDFLNNDSEKSVTSIKVKHLIYENALFSML